jgi:hypothetical protein
MSNLRLVLLVLFVLAGTTAANAQAVKAVKEVDDILERYEEKAWAIDKEASVKLSKLRDELKGELQKLQEKLTQESKLDEALFVREVIGKIGKVRPLRVLFHPTSKDYLLAASEETIKEATGKGYVVKNIFVGYVLDEPNENTVPLMTLVHRGRDDYFNTATQEGLDAGQYDYDDLRIEGHVFAKRHPGTTPIYLYWNNKDNATLPEIKDPDFWAAGYRRIRIEGWVLKSDK